MRLVGRVAASIAAITAVIAVLIAASIGLGGGLVMFVPIGLGVAAFFHYRRSRTTEIGWPGAGGVVATLPATLPSTEPLGGGQPTAPAVSARRGRFGVAGSLARVEARELIASPWVHVGIAFWLVILTMFGVLFVDDIDRSWLEFFGLTTLICHPFAAFAIVAAHRNRTRSRRDHCDELFDTCPADADARTLGHLATAWIAASIEVFFILLLVALIAIQSSHIYGPTGAYAVAAVAACAVMGAGAVALGVTLGRWAPWALVPFVAVIAVGIASGQINQIGAPAFSTDRMLATLVATTGIDAIFLPALWWERLAWFTAISVIVATLGLLGGRSTRVAAAVLGGAGLAAIVVAALVVRPATSDADRIADLVADPVAHSTCVPAGPGVEVCAYKGYEDLATDAAAAIEPVVDAVPEGVLRDVMFVAYYEQGFTRLTAEVQDALDGRHVQLPPRALRLRFNAHSENFEAVRLRIAARAVGLPADKTDDELPSSVAGQARGVIVLWLATRGLDSDARDALITADVPGPASATDRGAIWPGSCHEENQALQWSPSDLEAARALLALPEEQVRQVLVGRWTELTAPDATTDDVLIAMGAQPLGPPEPIELRQGLCA